MDGMTVLRRAQGVGLRVEAVGKMLRITGPKQAEPVVRLLAEHKAEVLAALRSRRKWQQKFTVRTLSWFNCKRNWASARRIAWGDLQNEWHSLYGKRWLVWQCAGCGKLIGGLAAIDMPDGNRVHFEPIDCLVNFGKRWRGDADAALAEFGLESPSE